MQCDSSNDVYCRIKCKQMINFCCIFAFSSVILGHIVERQSDFNKDLFSVPTENRRLKGAERERFGVWDREWERVEKMEMRRYSGMRMRKCKYMCKQKSRHIKRWIVLLAFMSVYVCEYANDIRCECCPKINIITIIIGINLW